MTIEKSNNRFRAVSGIHFDYEESFCGRPYIYLIGFRESFSGWDANTIGIALRDDDDFDVGLVYQTDAEHFDAVLHELINWMNDHEQGESKFEALQTPLLFFPDCGCEREQW